MDTDASPPTDPRSLPADVKRKLLAARDALTEGDAMEAYHQIYSIAAPHFDKLADEVWTGLESPSPEPGGWQPIETAPKTGRTLLLGYYNSAGKWRTMRGQWCSQAQIEDEWEEPENGREGWYESSVENDEPPNLWPTDPTHWMPTPTPPTKEEK